jgi:hypothetical protein
VPSGAAREGFDSSAADLVHDSRAGKAKLAIKEPDLRHRQLGSAEATAPEQSAMMLFGIVFLGLAIYGKRRKNATP